MGGPGRVVAAVLATAAAGYGAYSLVKWAAKKWRAHSLLAKWTDLCLVHTHLLQEIVDVFIEEMEYGLRDEENARMKMLITYVDRLPTGNESGVYYALDLGGSNFRVVRVTIGKGPIQTETTQLKIPHECMTGTGEQLFDFIAEQLDLFIKKEKEKGIELRDPEIGFTFSFPVKQRGIASGSLTTWTKGFTATGVEGEDVVGLLHKALDKRNCPIRVAALVNDTVGTLATAHYYHSDVVVGMILGTGTNAAYVERIDAIPKFTGPVPTSQEMVINMEWGNFYHELLPIIEADRELDEESWNTGNQVFEKMIGGMYLGDIARRMIVQMVREGGILGGRVTPQMLEHVFTTAHVSRIYIDTTHRLRKTSDILAEAFGLDKSFISYSDCDVAKHICRLVAIRAARLCAAGIGAVILKMGRDKVEGKKYDELTEGEPVKPRPVVVAADGSLIKKHPVFKAYVFEALRDIFGTSFHNFLRIELVEDGSGVGAALIGAVCSGQAPASQEACHIEIPGGAVVAATKAGRIASGPAK